eukprot:TRINITY_DN4596_c0_g1_i1.p1 TRINITY_DN4596_c0_g1~~TRINITY_DN4596_c0_g1_i1.p1  ORF type:complete len:261 (-),score=60.79 TRINITY_DN4596_c0_g1_i1:100-882(-)
MQGSSIVDSVERIRSFSQEQIDLLGAYIAIEQSHTASRISRGEIHGHQQDLNDTVGDDYNQGQESAAGQIPQSVLKQISRKIHQSTKAEITRHFSSASRRKFSLQLHELVYHSLQSTPIDQESLQRPLENIPTEEFPTAWPRDVTNPTIDSGEMEKDLIQEYESLVKDVLSLEKEADRKVAVKARTKHLSDALAQLPSNIEEVESQLAEEIKITVQLVSKIKDRIASDPRAKRIFDELHSDGAISMFQHGGKKVCVSSVN